MANWTIKDNVTVDEVYKKLDFSNTYLIRLGVPVQDSVFSETYEIHIRSTKLYKELNELSNGELKRCYFSFGMTDIDFYKVNDKFALTYSPAPGENTQLVLADGEMERLMNYLMLSK